MALVSQHSPPCPVKRTALYSTFMAKNFVSDRPKNSTCMRYLITQVRSKQPHCASSYRRTSVAFIHIRPQPQSMKHVQSIAITPKTMVCVHLIHNQNYNPQSQPEVSESKYDVVSSEQFSINTQRWETKTITVPWAREQIVLSCSRLFTVFRKKLCISSTFSKQGTYLD